MSTSEGLSFRNDITSLINELGEPYTFSRDNKKLVKQNVALGRILKKNDTPNEASPVAGGSTVISVPYSSKYVPELYDTVVTGEKDEQVIFDVSTFRFQDTLICYMCTIG